MASNDEEVADRGRQGEHRAFHSSARSGPRDVQNALEVQRRRWSVGGWTLIVLTLVLVLVAILFLPQGANSSGELQGVSAGRWVSYIKASAAFTVLVALAQQLFKLAVTLLGWAREKEKEQLRHLIWLRRSSENPAATMQAIQFIERGSSADTPKAPAKVVSRRKKDSLPAVDE